MSKITVRRMSKITDPDELAALSERVLAGDSDEYFGGDEAAVSRLGLIVLLEKEGALTGELYDNVRAAMAAFQEQRDLLLDTEVVDITAVLIARHLGDESRWAEFRPLGREIIHALREVGAMVTPRRRLESL